MSIVEQLCRELAEEQESLDSVVSGLSAEEWSRPTPAAGWDVLDSLSHLCFFDEAAALSVRDPELFVAQRDGLIRSMAAAADGATPDVALGRGLGDPSRLVQRWRAARSGYITSVLAADRRAAEAGERLRVEWYGPAMSPASFTTARLMETWAHGVDIRDALGVATVATPRLRHVCHIGYGARAYSFAAHGVEDPGDPVRLEVQAPDGGLWAWGPEDATDRITGTALEVALMFTQRRSLGHTAIDVTGPVAQLWLSIAQAFAGPPTVTAPDR